MKMISVVPSPQNKAVLDELENFFKRLQKPNKKALSSVSDAIRDGFSENFQDEQSGDGDRWEPLAPKTISERKRLGYPGEHPILERSGEYRDTFVSPSNPDHIDELTGDSTGFRINVGSGSDKLFPLETGGVVRIDDSYVFVPARPVVQLGSEQEIAIGQSLAKFFDSLI